MSVMLFAAFSFPAVDAQPLLIQFQLMLLENIIMCRLIMGNKTMAIQEVGTDRIEKNGKIKLK